MPGAQPDSLMERLPKIPSPPRVVLREFAHRVLPAVVFLAVLAAVAMLWQYAPNGRLLTGVAEGLRATVTSPDPGEVTQVLVAPYAEVRQGDPLIVLRRVDRRGELDALRTRMDLARWQAEPAATDSTLVDRERLRLDLGRARAELASARVRLEFARDEVRRQEPLIRDRLISEDFHALALRERDETLAEVEANEVLVRETEARLAQLDAMVPPPVPADTAGAQAEEMAAALDATGAEITLVAPADGMVGAWLRQPGEHVLAGDPLLVVHARRAERIVAYAREPLTFQPSQGLAVEVRRRTSPRERFASVVTQVGAQFEPITNALAVLRPGMLLDTGLPLVIDVPEGLQVRPGEIVDITLRRGPAAPAAAMISPR